MEKQYNLYNLEPSFKKYLLTENISPISLKNYMSDFRHFAGWLTFFLRSNVILNSFQDLIEMLKQVQHDTIKEYRSYLTTNNIPHKTINRRLSTVRKFCSFCISQGWMKENPAKQILNISSSSSRPSEARGGIFKKDSSTNARNDILSQFKSDLEKENLDQSVITSYLDDVRDFLKV